MNPLSQAQIDWIQQREWFFTQPNRSMTKEDGRELFAIYSWITGQTHRPTSCGRCVASAKAAVWTAYNQTPKL